MGFIRYLFAIRESDNRIIGIIDLRHTLNDFLKDVGNIGYSVRPSERRKGYATQMLQLILEHAKEIGLSEVHLSAKQKNIPSIKTIVKNGGKLVRSFEYKGVLVNNYLIELRK